MFITDVVVLLVVVVVEVLEVGSQVALVEAVDLLAGVLKVADKAGLGGNSKRKVSFSLGARLQF